MTIAARDQREHIAALDVLLGDLAPVYDFGRVPGLEGQPGEEPTTYIVRGVERVYHDARLLCGADTLGSWRAMIRCVDTTLSNARLLTGRVTLAVEDARLTFPSGASTPCKFETQQTDDPSDGRCSILTLFTYAAA